jgi:hypothetical protein
MHDVTMLLSTLRQGDPYSASRLLPEYSVQSAQATGITGSGLDHAVMKLTCVLLAFLVTGLAVCGAAIAATFLVVAALLSGMGGAFVHSLSLVGPLFLILLLFGWLVRP